MGAKFALGMRNAVGGDEGMWSEIITCRSERLPQKLQQKLNKLMKQVRTSQLSVWYPDRRSLLDLGL